MEEKIRLLREKVIQELSSLEDGIHIKLDYDPLIIESLLFYKENRTCKKFLTDFSIEILKKIDFSSVDFTGFYARGYDFSKLYGVRLNPQKVYEKDLSFGIFKGVFFTDSLDGCNLCGIDFTEGITDFTGSINAKLDPNSLGFKGIFLSNCKFSNVIFTKPFLGYSVFCLRNIDFTGSINATIYMQSLKDGWGLCTCKLKDVTLIGKIKCCIKGADFTGAKSEVLGFPAKVKIDPQKVPGKCFAYTKLNGVVITNSLEGAVIDNTDFTGSENAYVDLRKIDNSSNYKNCNFTGARVINIDGKEIEISIDGRITTNIEKSLDKLLGIEHESAVLSKQELESARNKLIEENRKKVQEKITELLKLVETTERLGVDPKNLYHSIPIGKEELLVTIDDHYEINRNFIEYLRFLNLSMIDFSNVKVSGLDFRGSAARINPQLVYKKDLSNSIFDTSNIKFYDDFTGVNIEGADFSECEVDLKEKRLKYEI